MKKVDFHSKYALINGLKRFDIKGFRFLTHRLTNFLLPIPNEAVVVTTSRKLLLKVQPSTDQGVEQQLYQNGTYEEGTLQFIEQHLKKGDVFADIGANIGLMSLVAAKSVGEVGKVFAFEAHPDTFSELAENIKLNNFTHIFAENVAIGKDFEPIYITLDSINKGASSIILSNGKGEKVDCKTIDSFQFEHMTMMKIDVEGFEHNVFLGAMETIVRCKPVIIFESNNEVGSFQAAKDIYALLHPLNYNFFKLSKSKDKKGKLIKILTADQFPMHDNVFCII
jgi:FkbM family methyltransferase